MITPTHYGFPILPDSVPNKSLPQRLEKLQDLANYENEIPVNLIPKLKVLNNNIMR